MHHEMLIGTESKSHAGGSPEICENNPRSPDIRLVNPDSARMLIERQNASNMHDGILLWHFITGKITVEAQAIIEQTPRFVSSSATS